MNDEEPVDVDAIAEVILPLGGPYDIDGMVAAAELAGELVRHLNHATFTFRPRFPSHADSLMSRVHTMAAGLPQLMDQLHDTIASFYGRQDLYSDEMSAGREPDVVVASAGVGMQDAARAARTLVEALRRVHNDTARLGVRTPPDPAPTAATWPIPEDQP